MRPAWTSRLCMADDLDHRGLTPQHTFHACWQHASKLEDDTFDVPGWIPTTAPVHTLSAADRDSAGVWCGFCA